MVSFITTWFLNTHSSQTVVLLDEADVFLEQRQLQQLERNALVSGIVTLLSNAEKYRLIVPVFLRVLEYYDGMLHVLFAPVRN